MMLMLLMLMLCQRCHYKKFEHHNFWKIQIRTIQEHIEVWVHKFQLIAAHALNQLCMKHTHIFPRRSYARWLVRSFVQFIFYYLPFTKHTMNGLFSSFLLVFHQNLLDYDIPSIRFYSTMSLFGYLWHLNEK